MKTIDVTIPVANPAQQQFRYRVVGVLTSKAEFVGEVVGLDDGSRLTIEPVGNKWEFTDSLNNTFTYDSFSELVITHSWFRLLWRAVFNQ